MSQPENAATQISPLAGKPAPRSCSSTCPARHGLLHRSARPVGAGAAGRVRHLGPPRLGVRPGPSTRRTCWRSARRSASTASEQGIDGPLFLGIDTHALSQPAFASALEVLAANGVEVMIATDDEYTPTPADLARDPHLQPRPQARAGRRHRRSRRRTTRPTTAASSTTRPTAARPDTTSRAGSRQRPMSCSKRGLQRREAHSATTQALRAATTHRHDFLDAYVADLGSVIDMDAIRDAKIRIGVDPLGGAGVHYWARIAERYRLDLTVVSDEVDPTFRFMTRRLGRPHPHGSVVALRDAAPARPEGPLRHRLRLRHRSRPPRHRHPAGRAAAAEPLPGGGHRLPLPASAAMGGERRRRQDRRQHADDRPGDRAARAHALRGSGRLQVVRRRTARRLARLRRRGERRRRLPAPRRHGLDDRQGRHGAGAARGRDDRTPAGATPARCTASLRDEFGDPVADRVEAPATPQQKKQLAALAPRAHRRPPSWPAKRSPASSATRRATARRSAASR